MSAAPFIVEIVGTFFVVLYLINKYGNIRHQNPLVTIATFIAWYFSFMIVFLLPLDISSTTYRQCLFNNQTSINKTIVCEIPFGFMTNETFIVIWRVIYWSSQALTWLILPFFQSYSQSGEFSMKGKLRGAFIANAIYYGIYLAICGVLLIYVAIKQKIDGSQLKVIGITASNTWGLFLLILLLGYGLIDIPRTIWFKSDYSYYLKQSYFQLAKIHTEKCEAEEELEDLVSEIKQLAERIKYNHGYRQFIDIIVQKCPESYRQSLRCNLDDFHDYNENRESNESTLPSEAYLVKLHTKLIKCIHKYKRTNGEWQTKLQDLLKLEDIEQTQTAPTVRYQLTKTSSWSLNVVEAFLNERLPIAVWFYYCIFKKYFLKLVAGVCALLTVTIIWSEMTFFNRSPVLSIFANILNLNRAFYNYLTIEFFCCGVIAYLCFCAYRTIFKIKLFNYYAISANQNSSENSLIFSGTLVCRLTAPLCYNFLCLVHLDSHITKDTNIVETSFTSIMGHMDLIKFINNGFMIYFPILIVFLCIATLFKWGERVLHFLGFQQFIVDTELTQELIEDGKNLVKREKRQFQRSAADAGDAENGGVYSRRKEMARKLRENYSTKSLLSSSHSTTYLSNENAAAATASTSSTTVKPSMSSKDINEMTYDEFSKDTKSLMNFNENKGSSSKRSIFDNI